jgi:hypothetical protein
MPASAERGAYQPPRHDDGRPNFEGMWVVTDGREGACLRSLDGPKESAWTTLEPRSTNPAIKAAGLKAVRIMMFPLDCLLAFDPPNALYRGRLAGALHGAWIIFR